MILLQYVMQSKVAGCLGCGHALETEHPERKEPWCEQSSCSLVSQSDLEQCNTQVLSDFLRSHQ